MYGQLASRLLLPGICRRKILDGATIRGTGLPDHHLPASGGIRFVCIALNAVKVETATFPSWVAVVAGPAAELG